MRRGRLALLALPAALLLGAGPGAATVGRPSAFLPASAELRSSLLTGRACTLAVPGGPAVHRDPCPLTDGAVGTGLGPPAVSVVIDTGRYQPFGPTLHSWPQVDVFADRGIASLATSADGAEWQPWATLTSGQSPDRADPAPPVWARWLRIEGEGATTLGDLEELAVLPPRPTASAREDVLRPPAFLYTRRGLVGTVVAITALSLLLMWTAQVRRRSAARTSEWVPPQELMRDPGRDGPPRRDPGMADVIDRLSFGVSLAALIIPLLTLVLLPIILTPFFIGLVFLVFIGAAFAKISLAVGAVAVVLLLWSAAQGGSRWRRGAVFASLGLAISAGILVVVRAVDDRERPVDEDLARAMPRPVPAAAAPTSVVRAAIRLAATGSTADRRRLCGLLAPSSRDDCLVGDVYDEGDGDVRLVSRHGSDAVVQYGAELGSNDALVVRLVHSRRGWELVDLPSEDGPGVCVTDAVESGRDVSDCPDPS